ncbi:MAG: hypothetical protein ABW252_17145 [Polyangiales bacterium]
MPTSPLAHVIAPLSLISSVLATGCAPDLDASAGDPPRADDEVVDAVGPRLSTQPIEPLQQTAAAPQTEAVQRAPTPSGRTDACGDVPAELTRDDTGRRAAAATRTVNARQNYVQFSTDLRGLLVRLQTKLTVPAKPPPSGVVFLWPGVQPLVDAPTFAPIGKGVLQPVLTWGSSCAPGSPRGYDSWWISGLYVNVATTLPTHRSCHGGPVMRVGVGDVLAIDIAQTGTVWKQTIKDLTTGQQVDYAIDMKGQAQGHAYFDIELPTSARPVADTVFTETVLSFASPRSACAPTTQGATDFVSKARISADGTQCCVDRITLRAPGVPATTTP